MVPCSSPYHRSPWWVTTGAAPWCGPWPASILRESGEHTQTHTVPQSLYSEVKVLFHVREGLWHR